MSSSGLFPSTFTPFDIEVAPGITIHGEQSPPSGPPLLLIHGYPQTHLIWHKAAPALAAHYTLIIPDLRGYGQSSKPAAPSAHPDDHSLYSKRAMGGDMSNLMHKLGHGSGYLVVGHDRGARTAHQLAIDRPAEVRRLVLLDIVPTLAAYGQTTQLFATSYWHWFFLIQKAPYPERVLLAAPEEHVNKQVCGMYAGREVFDERALAAYTALYRDPAGVHAMCEDYRAGASEDCEMQRKDREDGRVIQCPTRVIWGAKGTCQRCFDVVGEWSKVVKPGMLDEKGSVAFDCGHYIPEEKTEELVQSVLEFLKQ